MTSRVDELIIQLDALVDRLRKNVTELKIETETTEPIATQREEPVNGHQR